MNNLKPKTRKLIMFTGTGKVDMETLSTECNKVINQYYEKGINEITVELYVCLYKRHYIYLSRYRVLGVDTSDNRWVKLNKGVTPIARYVVAKWKYDHARAKDIEWNKISFSSDGYDVNIIGTRLDDEVMSRAKSDSRDHVIIKACRDFMNFLNKYTIGSLNVSDKKEESADDNYEVK